MVGPTGHTDTHTDGTDSIPSTADTGGKYFDIFLGNKGAAKILVE